MTPTMDSLYGDGSKHEACELCGFCIDCKDCSKFGCGCNPILTDQLKKQIKKYIPSILNHHRKSED